MASRRVLGKRFAEHDMSAELDFIMMREMHAAIYWKSRALSRTLD